MFLLALGQAGRAGRRGSAAAEHETALAGGEPVAALLGALGFVERIAFEKHCRNYPGSPNTAASCWPLWFTCHSLGITEGHLITEQYTDAAAAQRR